MGVNPANLLGVNEETGNISKSAKSLILTHMRQHPDGTTINEISKATKLPLSRIRKIISELENERELYARNITGVKPTLFYPNGKLIHQYLQAAQEFGSQIFRISFHEGRLYPMIQIQERSFSLLNGEKVEGSIFISYENVKEFIEFLQNMIKNFESYKR